MNYNSGYLYFEDEEQAVWENFLHLLHEHEESHRVFKDIIDILPEKLLVFWQGQLVYINKAALQELGHGIANKGSLPQNVRMNKELETLVQQGNGELKLCDRQGCWQVYNFYAQSNGPFTILVLNKRKKHQEKLQTKLYKELENARKIHRASLPTALPSGDKYHCEAYYNPAEYLGGDAYDFIEVDHGAMNIFFDHLVMVMIDVTGHGLDGSMMSLFLKDTVDHYFKHKHKAGMLVSPAELMYHLLKAYTTSEYPDEYFACVFLGVVEANSGTFTYTSAGYQVPGKIVGLQGEVTDFELGGLPLSSAISKELYDFKDYSFRLNPGETLFLATDGVFEQENEHGQTFDSQINAILSKYGNAALSNQVEALKAKFNEWISEVNQSDDVTCLWFRLSDLNDSC